MLGQMTFRNSHISKLQKGSITNYDHILDCDDDPEIHDEDNPKKKRFVFTYFNGRSVGIMELAQSLE